VIAVICSSLFADLLTVSSVCIGLLLIQAMNGSLPALTASSDTGGVFVPSFEESDVERCLDKQYCIDLSELLASILHYPRSVCGTTTSIPNLGL